MAGAIIQTVQKAKPVSPYEAMAALRGRGNKFTRWTLTTIAVLFLGTFILVPLGNVFYQALAKGASAYARTFVAPPKPDSAALKQLPFKERRKVERDYSRADAQVTKTRSAIRMTLTIAAIVVPLNIVFGVAAAWAVTKFRFAGRALLVSLIDLPFSVSPVVSGLIFVLLMGRQGFLEDWSTSSRALWLSPIVRAMPRAVCSGFGLLVGGCVVIGAFYHLGVLPRAARQRLLRGLVVATALLLLVVLCKGWYTFAGPAGRNWAWLAPSMWQLPDPSTLYWRGLGGGHWWPLAARETYRGVIFTPVAIVLATVFVTFPFVARSLIPLMESQGTDAEQAALMLGASGSQVFWRVTLPNIKWGLLYGVILCTARSLGEFGAVSVVSGHLDSNDTMPLRIEKLWQEYNTQAAFSVASLLACLAVVTLAAKILIERKATREAEPAAPAAG